MSWIILLPHEAQRFSYALSEKVQPLYYQHRAVSFYHRVKKKFGLSVDDNPFLSKIKFLGDLAELCTVKALWLSKDIVLSEKETEQLLNQLPGLQWVYSQRTGKDHLCAEIYKSRGISVSNTGTLVSAWVAQMNFACIMAQSKHLPEHIAMPRRHNSKALYCDDFTRQVVAIVGTGNIGNETARLCKAVGMGVIGLTRQPARLANAEYYDEICCLEHDLETVLSQADYVVLAMPLNEQTRGLISAERLALMKPSATLINLARPKITDENAMLACLHSHGIAAAYVSRLDQVSKLGRLRARLLSNLIITHNSEAHMLEKDQKAFEQFVLLLEQVMKTGEVGNQVVC